MRLIPALSLVALATGTALAEDIWLGHFEVQIDYTLGAPTPDAGWTTSISYDEDGDFTDTDGVNRLAPTDYRLVVTPSSERTINGFLTFVGTLGEPIWILQQANQSGQMFLGWRSTVPQGTFQSEVNGFFQPSPLGSTACELVSVSGTGPERGGEFAMWTTSGGFQPPEVHYNSADGISADDRLSPIQSGSHQHYNWGFTQPGTYEIEFRFSGRLNPQNGGTDTSTTQTFTFVVPFSGEVEDGDTLRIGPNGNAAWYDSEFDVEYAPNSAALIVDSVARTATFAIESGQVPPTARVGLSGDPVGEGFAVSGLELVDFTGPGSVSLSSPSTGSAELEFGADGIYRIRLRGVFPGETSEIIEIVALVGLSLDYSYSQWASSFEATHGLPSGALSDRSADFDGDGLGNDAEFQLFWQGFDPVVGDANKQMMPKYESGAARLTFLRDLHKDDFFSKATELNAAFAPAPSGPWTPWRAVFSEGSPDGFFERGAPLGNEVGPISRRQLKVPDASPELGFFRFELRNRP